MVLNNFLKKSESERVPVVLSSQDFLFRNESFLQPGIRQKWNETGGSHHGFGEQNKVCEILSRTLYITYKLSKLGYDCLQTRLRQVFEHPSAA